MYILNLGLRITISIVLEAKNILSGMAVYISVLRSASILAFYYSSCVLLSTGGLEMIPKENPFLKIQIPQKKTSREV